MGEIPALLPPATISGVDARMDPIPEIGEHTESILAELDFSSAEINELNAAGAISFERRMRKYTQPRLLAIDELGYLSFDSRSADLLFEVVTRRYEEKSTIVSTNRAFAQWNETFPNASCVVALVDRLIHRSEIVEIDGESYRHKEALERAEARAKERRARRRGKGARVNEADAKEVSRAR